MKFPVNSGDKGHLIGINLAHFEARNFAPGTGRVVPVLEIFGGKDKSCEKHTSSALHGSHGIRILQLLRSKVAGGNKWLYQDKVVKCNL